MKIDKRILISAIVGALLLLVFSLDLLSYVEHKVQDAIFQEPGMVDPGIAIIGIDDHSLTEIGRFQDWDRQIMADAINILNRDPEYKPAVIAIDFLYVEEGADKELDASLAEAAKNGGNVVLASLGLMSNKRNVMDHLIPYPPLSEYAGYGFANGLVDDDSLIRNAYLKKEFNGEYIYSFPAEIYRKYSGDTDNPFINENDEAYLTYSGMPGDYFQASFSDIFEEDFEPEFFADCVVFIGPYAAGLQDAYNTPIVGDVQMNGVEIHANAVQMMLEGGFRKSAGVGVNISILLALIAVGSLMFWIKDWRVSLGLTALVSVSYVFIAQWLFNLGYIITIIYPVFSIIIIYACRLVYGYVMEMLENQRVKSAFKKYVDPRLVDKLMETGEANSDEVGQKKNIAVLFVDVRGFTPMTEALKDEPELIVKILNEYLELTSSCVFNNGGSVDKFVGDATVALFNGFVPLDDYEFKAVKAAWDMAKGAEEVNASIKSKYGVDVGFGIGVNSGEAIVGNLGPSFRKDYTAIGDTVNTAARLEANAKRSQALISKNLYEAVKDRVEAESVGEIPLKGKSIKLEVFSVTGIKTPEEPSGAAT